MKKNLMHSYVIISVIIFVAAIIALTLFINNINTRSELVSFSASRSVQGEPELFYAPRQAEVRCKTAENCFAVCEKGQCLFKESKIWSGVKCKSGSDCDFICSDKNFCVAGKGEARCTDRDKRCFGLEVQGCKYGEWYTIDKCEEDCLAGECVESAPVCVVDGYCSGEENCANCPADCDIAGDCCAPDSANADSYGGVDVTEMIDEDTICCDVANSQGQGYTGNCCPIDCSNELQAFCADDGRHTWSEPNAPEYCANCNHCQDGVCNCGETSTSCLEDCTRQPCTDCDITEILVESPDYESDDPADRNIITVTVDGVEWNIEAIRVMSSTVKFRVEKEGIEEYTNELLEDQSDIVLGLRICVVEILENELGEDASNVLDSVEVCLENVEPASYCEAFSSDQCNSYIPADINCYWDSVEGCLSIPNEGLCTECSAYERVKEEVDTKIVVIGDSTWEIEAPYIGDISCKLKINGELTDELGEGQSDTESGLHVCVSNIIEYGYTDVVELCLAASEDAVEVPEETTDCAIDNCEACNINECNEAPIYNYCRWSYGFFGWGGGCRPNY